MKQLIQSLKDGKVDLFEAPTPNLKNGHILISTSCSAISSGTEKMLLDFGRSNLLKKALSQPDKVSEALNKVNTDGLLSTASAIKSKLNSPIALGYSNVGTVIKKANDINSFKVGDRVVSNGNHAEQVLVPKNLCCLIPDSVSDEEASFAVIGSVALQGIRLAKPNYGEKFLVVGLGIIGQITAQLLKSNGCEVYAMDINNNRCEIAREFSVNCFHLKDNFNAISWSEKETGNLGFDGVIVTASSKNSEPLELAAKVSKKRGKIVLVGSTKIELNRNVFYEKELSFQVSKSYGPGRYDNEYEERGNDYPFAYVRWTEKRNIEAVLRAIELGNLNVKPLISDTYDFENIVLAYEKLRDNSEKMGILIKYKRKIDIRKTISLPKKDIQNKFLKSGNLNVGVIGCGNYFSRVIIPILKNTDLNLNTLVTSSPIRSSFYGKKFNFENVSTDVESIIKNSDIDIVFIGTRHDSHGYLVKKFLDAKKHIYVEKPLCLNYQELEDIKKSYKFENTLMIGFNRRYSPIYKIFKEKIQKYKLPKSIIYTCNSGDLPKEHWLNDIKIGGGRLIGEACHFLDLIKDLIGFPVERISLNKSSSDFLHDTFTLNLNFADGSIASIHYFSNGNKQFSKEKIQVFVDQNIFELDNFKDINIWERNKRRSIKRLNIEKGQKQCINAFMDAIKNNDPEPIGFADIVEIHSLIMNI